MIRFNIFNLIHKALRNMLYDTALCMQQSYFGDKQDTIEAFEKMNAVIEAFEMHGHTEDTMVMPYIQKFKPELITSFEDEHVNDRSMGNHLRQLQTIYHSLHNAEELVMAGSAISKAFRDYMIYNLEHMQREEIELNQLLWDNFTDAEIIAMNDDIVQSMPQDKAIKSLGWFMAAVNYQEAVELLQGIRQSAPAPAFEAILTIAEAALPEKMRCTVMHQVKQEDALVLETA